MWVTQASVSPPEVGRSCRWVKEDQTGISSSELGKYGGLDSPQHLSEMTEIPFCVCGVLAFYSWSGMGIGVRTRTGF